MKPVIIIGAGRSGTKFLRSLLASSQAVSAVPYDVNYIWREGNESCPHDELRRDSLTPVLKQRIVNKLKDQINTKADHKNFIFLEKTVSNSLRVDFVNAVLPDALFIHLIRDGRDVVESAYRCWRAPPDIPYLLKKLRTFPVADWRYGAKYAAGLIKRSLAPRERAVTPWGPRYERIHEDLRELELIEVVARQWQSCIRRSYRDLENIPENRKFEIRYEDLVSNSSKIVDVSMFIGIPDIESVTKAYADFVKKPGSDGWENNLSSNERKLAQKEIENTLDFLGY